MSQHVEVYRQQHPKASASGCIYAHVEVAEKALGKLLPAGAEVHHVDGDPRNNARSNLVVCQDRAYHKLLHYRTKVVRAGGNPNTQKFCRDCGSLKALEAFNVMRANKSTGRQAICRECQRARWQR